MKISNLSKLIGASVLGVSLAVLPLTVPANAQTNTGSSGSTTGSSGTAVDNTSRTTTTTRDNDFDWGWLGLLGLGGLAGLIPRKREESVRYRDPGEVNPPGSRL